MICCCQKQQMTKKHEKINFFEKFFQEYHQSVNSLNPDQARQNIRSDQGSNDLQRLSADDTTTLVGKEFTWYVFCAKMSK